MHCTYQSLRVLATFWHRTRADAIKRGTGCKGTYVFMKLPDHDRILQTVPDCMHTVKDAVEHIINLITGREDSQKVRMCEIATGRFDLEQSEHPILPVRKRKRGDAASGSGAQQNLPVACYRLTAENARIADERLSSVISPCSDFTPTKLFSKTSGHGLKSHDWKEVRVHLPVQIQFHAGCNYKCTTVC